MLEGVEGQKYRFSRPERKEFPRNLIALLPFPQWNVVGFFDAPQAKLEPIVPFEFRHHRQVLRVFVVRRTDGLYGRTSIPGCCFFGFVISDQLRDLSFLPDPGLEPIGQ